MRTSQRSRADRRYANIVGNLYLSLLSISITFLLLNYPLQHLPGLPFPLFKSAREGRMHELCRVCVFIGKFGALPAFALAHGEGFLEQPLTDTLAPVAAFNGPGSDKP